VLAFSLSVVDVAIILGPSQPPPLSLLATRWFSDYDLSRYPVAAAAAVLQLVVVIAAIGLWRVAEIPIAALGLSWIEGGSRGFVSALLTRLAGIAALLAGGFGLAAILGMVVWSFALIWRFPDAWPSALGFATWSAQSGAISPALANTAIIGTAATGLAIVLVLACLENEVRHGQRPGGAALWLLFVPLLAPQIAFLFGVQVALVRVGLDGTLSAVIWSHLIFVLPYVFLSLADPFRALDPRLPATAAALGAGPMRVFATIKLPLLLRPLLVAVAVGFAVSVGQYLATLFPGAGRISTLTTDAVTLASGADRRIIGVYAALQATLPLLVYAAALGVPALLYRHRQALHP
jgi:putative thiamine transport system permease protein